MILLVRRFEQRDTAGTADRNNFYYIVSAMSLVHQHHQYTIYLRTLRPGIYRSPLYTQCPRMILLVRRFEQRDTAGTADRNNFYYIVSAMSLVHQHHQYTIYLRTLRPGIYRSPLYTQCPRMILLVRRFEQRDTAGTADRNNFYYIVSAMSLVHQHHQYTIYLRTLRPGIYRSPLYTQCPRMILLVRRFEQRDTAAGPQ